MKKRIIWDTENDVEATNWDGTIPKIVNRGKTTIIIIKELVCLCGPPGCGGCADDYQEHEIGKRYIERKGE